MGLQGLKKHRLGRTGLLLPRVSLGTWSFGGRNRQGNKDIGWAGHSDEAATQALKMAASLGIIHWDTADVYGEGRSEALIGGMWEEGLSRDDIVLSTKVGFNKGPHEHFYHPRFMKAQLENSLRNLKTDHVDIYYFHHSDFGPDARYLGDAMRVMEDLKREGKIRFVGLSDWSEKRIMKVIDAIDPDVVQPYRNATHQEFERSGLQDWAKKHDLGVAFFSPLRHGLLLGKYKDVTHFPPGDFRNRDNGFKDLSYLKGLEDNAKKIEERFGKRLREPVLAALMALCLRGTESSTVLLGQRNREQVEAAYFAAQARFSQEELAWIQGLYDALGEASPTPL